MFQFKQYPIYVAYTRHHQDVMGAGISRYKAEHDYEGAKFYRNVAMTSEDTAPEFQKEVKDFEKLIKDRLTLIEAVPLAKMLLQRIKDDVWIVPKPTGFPCYCAITGPLDYQTSSDAYDYYEGKGETIIRFDPNDDFKDDTL